MKKTSTVRVNGNMIFKGQKLTLVRVPIATSPVTGLIRRHSELPAICHLSLATFTGWLLEA
jgi:hypothetical protein